MFRGVSALCGSTNPAAMCSGHSVQPKASQGTVLALRPQCSRKHNSSIVWAPRQKTVSAACQADPPRQGSKRPRERGSCRGLGSMDPPCWGCALAAGAGRGSQPPVPGWATARRGELVAVFLLDVWLKVPVGRSELGCGRRERFRGRQVLVN